MKTFSFIDFGTMDFVRDYDGQPLRKLFNNYDEAENKWLDDDGDILYPIIWKQITPPPSK